MIILVLIVLGIFIKNALQQNLSVKNRSDSPMYGFDPDTIGSHAPPERPLIQDTGKIIPNPMTYIKERLLQETYYCFDKNAEYCPKDDDFLEPIIQQALDHLNKGILPQREGGVEAILQLAKSLHSTALRTPDGLARMEALVQKRFENPVVIVGTDWQHTVTVDYGAFPGKLAVGHRRGYYYKESSHFEEQQFNAWRSVEVAKELQRWHKQYPSSKAIVLHIHNPSYRSYTYTYFPAITAFRFWYTDGLVYNRKDASARLQEINPDLSLYTSGKASLYELPDWQPKYDPDVPHKRPEQWVKELLDKVLH